MAQAQGEEIILNVKSDIGKVVKQTEQLDKATKKGKSGPKLKEDWKFESYGTWEMKGDTIHILTDRFVCPRQNLWELKVVDEKEQWVLNEQPTFDDSVTDGSQDRHISYSNLIEDFRK